MIRVLVVEDDFRVGQVHAAFTEQVPGFTVVGTARTAVEARELVGALGPDLVLLDHYLPDESGLSLLRELTVDTIMLTAASDAGSVRAAFAAGALNYLVKPFTAEQLADRLTAYARYHAQWGRPGRAVNQEEIDRAMRVLHEGDRVPTPKGQSPVTARLVADALRSAGEARSAAEIAAELGIARATAQRYLAALAQSGSATMSLRYGATGRPEHQYLWSQASR
ncbi:two-component system, CitB family, response regulator [Streptoalloteichus tenebrarius]|uniref:Transcriptional regulatory protein n=1 Tax=Streptoalloteichus tenebrarius (strain ATCC 17920 / DSM 40477 / JCM 4838 / CBS 697.72 / NBRC 16177 / NCIMB 11028 / NRRL B-12390 / A12253. 1 / ISP 5477) TaxID=1933 RepID=A0ABT1HWY7_STRSD|nr:response regulator [Streptoalloteichus tenebrarius]MCP2260020.1 two-component system, CitB family, response regulator [Streptoalloteichus tenebrarius]BFF03864.1 response regulator [Streptoalloteichus tenebrarius]